MKKVLNKRKVKNSRIEAYQVDDDGKVLDDKENMSKWQDFLKRKREQRAKKLFS